MHTCILELLGHYHLKSDEPLVRLYKILVLSLNPQRRVGVSFPRAQTTASLRFGGRMMDDCWRHFVATLLRSRIWPSAMRTP